MDLRQLASHYYELAARLLELFEEEEIVDVLSEVRYSPRGWGRPRTAAGADVGMGESFGTDLLWWHTDL